MRRSICLLTALLISVCLCACSPSVPAHTATFYEAFDTVTVFTAYTDSDDTFARFRDILTQELHTYHRLFDIYQTYEDTPNNLCDINKSAGGEPVSADPRIISMLRFGEDMYTHTDGRVNVLLGAVLRLWHTQRDAAAAGNTPALPDDAALKEALTHTALSAMTLDTAAGTVQLAAGAALDVGAIGKGFALEQAAQTLEKDGCVGILNAGGNVRTLGEKPNGDPWTVRITHTLEDSSPSLDIHVGAHVAVATSGDYQRYYTVDGVRYPHIIDPATGYPARHMRAVTVVCNDAALADALSTALFLMPVEEGLSWVDTLNGVEAVYLDNEENWRYSSGFSAYLA